MRKLLQLKFLMLLVFSALCFSGQAFAQGVVSGTVTDSETGETLIGVNILINELDLGVPTDAEGYFELRDVPAGEYQLEASFVGFNTIRQPVTVTDGEETAVDLVMEPSTAQLDELVVTSFGLEQERKALGYSVQEIDSERLNAGSQSNVVNALSGKISGVQVTNTGGAPGRNSRIIIRGITSLNSEANNEPLFVVDGVPIDNSFIDAGDTPRGLSNRAADINPNDIESVNVLKGSAATSLYGVRAANGAVIITTKSGREGDMQVNFNTTAGFDRINSFPEFQTRYGQGWHGEAEDGFWPNWGAPYDETSDQEYNDIWRDATQTGTQFENALNVSGGNEFATYYASVANLQQDGVIPYGDWDRTSAKLSGDIRPYETLRISSSVNFVNSGGNRIPADRFMERLMYWAPNKDVTDFEFEDGTMKGYYGDGSAGTNPLYDAKYSTYEDDVNRVVGNVAIDFAPVEGIDIIYRFGTDYYSDQRTNITPGPLGIAGENVLSSTGFILEDRINSRDLNSTLNLSLERSLTEKIDARLRVGNDIFERSRNRITARGDEFVTPQFYHLSNVRDLSTSQNITKSRLVGAYGDLLLDYDDFLYINITGRNDWSSTLPADNRSFFYPSVNVGFSFSDVMDLPDYITYGKLRASYAQVGKDADPYLTSVTYNTPSAYPIDGRVGFSRSDILGSEDLKPERTTSWELGTDLRFLDNRLGLDFTWYQSNSADQILRVPISESTGYNRIVTNAGEIQNRGIEIQLNVVPVQTQSFQWEMDLNFTRNRNEVVEIREGIDNIAIGSSFGYLGSGASIQLIEGDSYGNIYGQSYARYYPENGGPDDDRYLEHDAPLLIGDDGFPILNTEQKILGNSQPDWVAGINNSFSYKNLNLSFLIDIKQGLDVYNQYAHFFSAFGLGKESLNREDMVVFDGFTADGERNTQEVWMGQGTGPDGEDYGDGFYRSTHRLATENFVVDASYIKLRNLRLAYTLPESWLENIPLRNVTASATATNIILYSPFDGFDPEARQLSGAGNADGFTGLDYPGVSSFLFSLNFSL